MSATDTYEVVVYQNVGERHGIRTDPCYTHGEVLYDFNQVPLNTATYWPPFR